MGDTLIDVKGGSRGPRLGKLGRVKQFANINGYILRNLIIVFAVSWFVVATVQTIIVALNVGSKIHNVPISDTVAGEIVLQNTTWNAGLIMGCLTFWIPFVILLIEAILNSCSEKRNPESLTTLHTEGYHTTNFIQAASSSSFLFILAEVSGVSDAQTLVLLVFIQLAQHLVWVLAIRVNRLHLNQAAHRKGQRTIIYLVFSALCAGLLWTIVIRSLFKSGNSSDALTVAAVFVYFACDIFMWVLSVIFIAAGRGLCCSNGDPTASERGSVIFWAVQHSVYFASVVASYWMLYATGAM